MCVLATGSRIDPILIIVRVTYWRLPSVINPGHLKDSIGGRLLLNLPHLFILVTVQREGEGVQKRGGERVLNVPNGYRVKKHFCWSMKKWIFTHWLATILIAKTYKKLSVKQSRLSDILSDYRNKTETWFTTVTSKSSRKQSALWPPQVMFLQANSLCCLQAVDMCNAWVS